MTFGKKLLYHLVPLLLFFVLASIFFAPLYQGKVLVQSDNVQLTGVNREVILYQQQGEEIFWNNREFSGVPLQRSSKYNPVRFLNNLILYGLAAKPIMMLLYLFAGMYVLFVSIGVSRWMSGLGAFAFAFSSFNVISIEVGHDNKVLAMASMAPVLAAVFLAYRGELIKGAVIAVVGAGFQLYFGHVQITYYTLIMVLGYLLVALYQAFQTRRWTEFAKASAVLTLATVIAFGCNFTKLYSLVEYADYSTRGGSELTQNQSANASSDGLDKDYALSWSSGILETFTLIFPYFHGGASSEKLSTDSDTYQAMVSRGVDRRTAENVVSNAPLYWGSQPFTGGPIYFGAVICFLFLAGMQLIKGPIKWWGLGLFVLALLLAMGKNLEWFTDIFFYYVPLYNKFRSVTMIYSIAQLLVPLVAIIALDKILRKEIAPELILRSLLYSGILVIGVGIFMILFKDLFFNFKGQNDGAYGFPDWLIDAVVSDRKRLFVSDILRSIGLSVAAASAIWLIVKNYLQPVYPIALIVLLVVFDLWIVDKRYLGSDDFQTKRRITESQFRPTSADVSIMNDDGHFRVLNLATQNPFSDGLTSYFHKSILGYSAIKMQRYQELIDKYLRGLDPDALNMLNTKYLIVKGEQGPQAQLRQDALGNAWLVKNLVVVDDADEELDALGTINMGMQAALDRRFEQAVNAKSYTGQGDIELASYHPENMQYRFSALQTQFAVFSEIYYEPGWNAYIDGERVDYVRVNYVLRGLEIPEGEHQIEFRYEPVSVYLGTGIIIGSTVFLIAFLSLLGYLSFVRNSPISRTSHSE